MGLDFLLNSSSAGVGLGIAPLLQHEMKLSVKYRGPAVDEGRMNALDLGPAIIGLGEMVGAASRVLFNDDTRVRVEVQADFPHASFGIDYSLVASAADLISALDTDKLEQIAKILGFTGGAVAGGVKGVLWLLRWQNGRKIDSVERVGDVYHIIAQGDSTNVTVNEYHIYVDPVVRRGLANVVKPLESEGVTEIGIKAADYPEQTIEREERRVLSAAPLPTEDISVDLATAVLEVVMPALRGKRKWLFAQGEQTFFADMLDEQFLKKVASRRDLFGSGDALRVEIEVHTTRTAEGLSFERKIIRVLDHIPNVPGGGQISLL